MPDVESSPPIGLAASLDIAMTLHGCASPDEGIRSLSDRMASAIFDRFAEESRDERSSRYLTELTAALWAASMALVEARAAALARLTDTRSAYTKSRQALDRLVGVGSLGATGWLARIGGLVAGFSLTQIVGEIMEHEEEVSVVVNESGALFREIEIGIVTEIREPEFEIMLALSLLMAVIAAVAVGMFLRWYRTRRIGKLTQELDRVQAEVTAEAEARRTETTGRLVRTLVCVMERHYPGAAAEEIASVLGATCDVDDLLAGACDDAVTSFAQRHIAANPFEAV